MPRTRALALLLAGCHAPADLADPDVVTTLALRSFPDRVVGTLTLVSVPDDPELPCPHVTNTMTEDGFGDLDVRGGCVDGDGTRWDGRVQVSAEPGRIRGSFDHFAYEDEDGFARRHGELSVDTTDVSSMTRVSLTGDEQSEDDRFTFDVDYTADEHADGDVWRSNADGRLWFSDVGAARVRIRDLVSGPTCDAEWESGTLELDAGGHAAVISFDGATDCDDPPTATWTHDGVAMGVIEGLGPCGTTPGGPWWLALVLPFALRRRVD